MSLEKRGEWWYGTESADLDAFLLQVMGRPDYAEAPHRIVQAVCAGCMGTHFWLSLDESDNARRICVNMDCPDRDGHFICCSRQEYDEDSEEDCGCTCHGSRFELAIGFKHTLVRVGEEEAWEKNGKLIPAVSWVFIAARCVQCGLVGLYAEQHHREFPTDHLYKLV
jgi:hypothetical protein